MPSKSSLSRRRGARRSDGNRTVILIGLVILLVIAALLLGLLLGSHVFSGVPEKRVSAQKPVALDQAQLRGGKSVEELHDIVRQRIGKFKKSPDDDAAAEERHADPADHDIGHQDDDKPQPGDEHDEHDGEPPDQTDKKPPPEPAGPATDPYPYSLDPVPDEIDFKTWTAPGGSRFKEYTNGNSPYLISPEQRKMSDIQARSRRQHVKNAFLHAWTGYSEHAFGHDEVLPQTGTMHEGWGGMGTTLVDSLDTLWLMDFKDDFMKCRDWVRDKMTFENAPQAVSVFETTIRSLGGLLSAYDWSGDDAFLEKAKDLGARMFPAFDTISGIPMGTVNLKTAKVGNLAWTGSNAIVAEGATLQVEYRYLAKMANLPEYAQKAEHVFEVLKEMDPAHGLYPYYIKNQKTPPTFGNAKLTFGAMADSFYEYMLKIWLQGGKTEPMYREMYDTSIQGMHDELLQKSTPSGLWFIADKNSGSLDTKMDHLVCFMGGLLALGAYTDPLGLDSERAQRDLKTGKALTYTCYQMYARMNTGISPEFVQFNKDKDFQIGRGAPHYLLRPEAFESFFILNYLTGDPVYREWGWETFSAIERYCKTDIAYGALHDVSAVDKAPENKMESFFLAETLKYLYLLQDPDTEVDILHTHVFNTEAHPMRIFPVIDAEAVNVVK